MRDLGGHSAHGAAAGTSDRPRDNVKIDTYRLGRLGVDKSDAAVDVVIW